MDTNTVNNGDIEKQLTGFLFNKKIIKMFKPLYSCDRIFENHLYRGILLIKYLALKSNKKICFYLFVIPKN